MRGLALGIGMMVSAFGQAAIAEGPVVVELYTSQGCSSCPPADEILAELSAKGEVIALALHVDYWDYIGWADTFADPAYTERQRDYARFVGADTIYTPQFVVNGQEFVVGARDRQLNSAINAHQDGHSGISVAATRGEGGQVTITAEASMTYARDLIVQVVSVLPDQEVAIRRGENAGRTLTYSNIVAGWSTVAEWATAEPLAMTIDVDANAAVILIQEPGPGAIVAASRIR